MMDIRIPELGENIRNATVGALLVSPGESVVAEQQLIELESDKATLELPAPEGGIIEEILVREGDVVEVGQSVIILKSRPEAPPQDPSSEASRSAQSPAPLSSLTEPPASPLSPSREAAAPRQPRHEETPTPPVPYTPAIPSQTGTVTERSPLNAVPAAPSVRRLARELGVPIESVRPSGAGGRISMEDVKEFVRTQKLASDAAPSHSPPIHEAAYPYDWDRLDEIRREPLSNLRKRIGESLSLSWRTIPHVTQFDEADIFELERFRKERSKETAAKGVKLTLTAFAIKIAAMALRRHPLFNAGIDLLRGEIVHRTAIHMGVAVDTPRGLVVPVIRNADRKGIYELSAEVAELAEKARNKKLTPEEMRGSSFSISNLGGPGSTHFTPIIQWPLSAILGVGRARRTPVYRGDELTEGLILPLSLSYDHRLHDGADAARFMRWIAKALENPLHLLMEGEP